MTPSSQNRMGTTEWGIIALLSVIWGGSFLFLKIALRELPPFTLVLVRVGGAGILMYAIMAMMGRPRFSAVPGLWRSFFILAAFNNAIPFVLFAYGQSHIAIGLASILNATTPLWGVIVAHFFTPDEKATVGKIAGVAIGISGVVVMVGSAVLAKLGDNVLAQLACLVATLCYAIASVYGRRFKAQGIRPMEVSTGQLLAAAALILPIALVTEAPWTLPAPSMSTILAMTGFVVLSTTFAYFLYFKLLESAGATNSLLVTFLIPITAILLGTIFLDESLEPKHYLGMGLIGLGLAAIDGRPYRLLFTRANASKEARSG